MKIKKIDDTEIVKAIQQSKTMAEANSKLGMHFNTFKKHASRLGLYTPNQGGKGTVKEKKEGAGKIYLNDILEGKYPEYQTFKLKNRLIKEGIKENKCENCGLSSWLGKNINCELDHINGVSTDHRLENLQILCPNCHSQTDTFRAKNKKNC